MAKIYLVGENLLALESVKFALENNGRGYQIECGNLQDSIYKHKARNFDPDILFWANDLVESGIEVMENCRRHSLVDGKYILALSPSCVKMLGKGIDLGIEGFIYKSGGIDDLKRCIDALMSGKGYISRHLGGRINLHSNGKCKTNPAHVLTRQELKILKLVYHNLTSKRIAQRLNISFRTVQNHRQNICRKLGIKGQGSLKRFAIIYFKSRQVSGIQ